MNNKVSPLSILFIILLLVTLVGGVILTGQNQNQQRGAYFSGASISMMPTDVTADVGSTFITQLWVDTANAAKVNTVNTTICYGNGLSLDATDPSSLVEVNNEAFKVIQYINDDKATKCLNLLIASIGIPNENLKSGLVKVANIKFKAVAAGSGKLELKISDSIVGGYNPAGTSDSAMQISSVTNANYVIGGSGATTPPTSVFPILRFKMSFAYVNKDSKCALPASMPLTVVVRAADATTKTYSNITTTKNTASTATLAEYDVSMTLADFPYKDNLAVFVKSGKSLQVKYGVDNQNAYYGKSGGEISGLSTDQSYTPTFDFTKYPLLMGDVTSSTSGVQDGQIDGSDFSYVKTEANKRTSTSEGGYMLADLNGNCQMESQDLSNLLKSLEIKQGQLY